MQFVLFTDNLADLSMAEACRRYSLSSEEFLEWERHYKEEGIHGLRASARHPHQPQFH